MKAMKLARVVLAALGGMATAEAAEAQPVRFLVSWSGESEIVRPAPRVARFQIDIEVTLQGGNRVSERYLRRNAAGQVAMDQGGEATFREELEGIRNARWVVKDARTLMRVFDVDTHVGTVVLTTDGKKSCRASFSNRLKPGQSLYMIPIRGGREYASQIRIGAVTCKVL